MVDFVSQYPTVMYGVSKDPQTGDTIEWNLPKGPCQRVENPTWSKEGAAKVWILPPKNCFAPLVGYNSPSVLNKGAYEVLYGLCKICMDERSVIPCVHADHERAFVATEVYPIIRRALEMGYRILKIYDAIQYEESSNTLFRDFLTPFIIIKSISKRKGLVHEETNQLTKEGEDLCKYLSEIDRHGKKYSADDFSNSPVSRQVAKNVLNSFSGKWGQRDDLEGSETFYKNNFLDREKLT
jgi:hypothetical protein